MRLRQSKDIAGFTLIEMLVVLGLIAILTAITIPVLSSGGGIFSRDELKRTAQVIHSKLQAAQIYANTYRVNTAVVYALDNWVEPVPTDFLSTPPYNPPLASPLVDSLTNNYTRAIVAAAVMYELPLEAGSLVEGMYVPIPTEEGAFETFPGDSVITLKHPNPLDVSTMIPLNPDPNIRMRFESNGLIYSADTSRYEPSPPTTDNFCHLLGMEEIPVITGDFSTFRVLLDNQTTDPTALSTYLDSNKWPMPAHKFSRVGKMQLPSKLRGAVKERFIIYATPSPLDELDNRFVYPDKVITYSDPEYALMLPDGERITIPLEIFRSTGRVRIGG